MQLHYWGRLSWAGEIDNSDFWPRYYFDFEVAKSETIAWLKTRELFIPDVSVWTEGGGNPGGPCCGIEVG